MTIHANTRFVKASTEDGNSLTPLALAPEALPRIGEAIPIESGVTWRVADVRWQGHPKQLEPTLILKVDSE